eukprot:m.238591 g.238591  ORF g.238591 m.238591 type:complete len:651 (+) comp40165_c2_seq4:309-2261(+)
MFKTCRVDQDKGQGLTSCSPKPKSRITAIDVQAMTALDPKTTDFVRELARERQLRLEAENTCRDLHVECDRYKAKMQESQKSFNRIHAALEAVRQYRQQIECLQHEKGQQEKRYESNLSRLREQLLLLEGQKGDLQCRLEECRFQTAEGSDKEFAQLLMRTAHLEKMNMQLTADAANQRQHFDKCLDKFASQVTKTLMEQKSLKRENDELQRKNAELQRTIYRLEMHLGHISDDSGISSVTSSKLGSNPPVSVSLPDGHDGYGSGRRGFHHKLRLRSSNEDLFNSVRSPGGMRPSQSSPLFLNHPVPAMRRVRSDNTPDLLEYPGRMYRTESRDSISSECSDVPVVNYWEMYQQKQKTVIPENLRRARQGSGMSASTSSTSLPASVFQNAPPSSENENETKSLDFSTEMKTDSTLLDQNTRMEMLDDMLGEADDSEEADSFIALPGFSDPESLDPPDAMEYLRCIRRRNMEGAIGHSNIIEFSKGDGFRRYGDEEEEAIREFEFLADIPSESDVEDERRRSRASSRASSSEHEEFRSKGAKSARPMPLAAKLDSEAIGSMLNGRRSQSPAKKTSKVTTKMKHATSLTTIIGNIRARVTRRSASPEVSRIAVMYGEADIGRRLGNTEMSYTPTSTPEVARRDATPGKSTLI